MFLGASHKTAHSKLLDSDYDTFGSGNFESANIGGNRGVSRVGGRTHLSVRSDLSD